jgi:UDP-N-acetylmuramate: L-alanyl-gamma-D-glutamyl-meso-diaminopimelate ligase
VHVHVLGVCGTFMAGVALLARELGHEVAGCDAAAYPPMSDQLRDRGIEVLPGYDPAHLIPAPDVVVVGNALSRGNPAVEHVLDAGLPYVSGPAWLAEQLLAERHVLAVAGTHGKTTTASLLAWILDAAGLEPGFLIGGVASNFGISARLGSSAAGAPFVVEADEYDTAFFDKRSKFVHYGPRTLVINGLEYDHADIFADMAEIRRQFHHLVRTVPRSGLIVRQSPDPEIDAVLEQGLWTPVQTFGEGEADWRVELTGGARGEWTLAHGGDRVGRVRWPLLGAHNARNGAAAVAAAAHAGVEPARALAALADFRGVRRRLELRGTAGGVAVYDDFAHHPTAIEATLAALRPQVGEGRLVAVVDPASNTMRMGVHRETLGPALDGADRAWIYQPPRAEWDLADAARSSRTPVRVLDSVQAIVDECAAALRPGDRLVVMSNGAFEDIHERLLRALDGDDARE